MVSACIQKLFEFISSGNSLCDVVLCIEIVALNPESEKNIRLKKKIFDRVGHSTGIYEPGRVFNWNRVAGKIGAD